MRNKIIEYNNFYKPALERVEEIRKNLGRYCIDHALVFFNNHHIRIDNIPEQIKYPIPSIICKLSGIQTKIGFDIVTDKDYIGFIKFTFNKEEFLTFNFDPIKTFKFEVYNNWFCEEVVNLDILEQVKNYVENSNEQVFYIKIKISNIEQINAIIHSISVKPQKGFSTYTCVCNCGNQITIEADFGECPICGKDSPYKKIIKTKCPVCAHATLLDKFGNGECDNCGWLIDKMSTKCHNEVVYPNLIPLDKAKKLYREGKPFNPDLSDFLDGFNMYGEMFFKYNNIECELIRSNNNGGISFCYEEGKPILFENKEDFIQNAKIGDEFVRDIWNDVEDPSYM